MAPSAFFCGAAAWVEIDVLVAVIREQLGHHFGRVLDQPEAPDIYD